MIPLANGCAIRPKNAGSTPEVKSSTDHHHNIAVQGRFHAKSGASHVDPPTHASIDDLAWFRFTTARLGDIQGTPVIVSRTGYSESWDMKFSATRTTPRKFSTQSGQPANPRA